MFIFFRVLSAFYIGAIFLLVDSPVVDDVAAFNPCSLLHIPLYGFLTLFLILAFPRQMKKSVDAKNSIDPIDSKDPINPTNSSNPSNSRNYFVAGIIALVVAIADEIHQAYIPSREASIRDVFLDIVGIVLCILIIKRVAKIPWFSKKIDFLRSKSMVKQWKSGEKALRIV